MADLQLFERLQSTIQHLAPGIIKFAVSTSHASKFLAPSTQILKPTHPGARLETMSLDCS